MAMVKYKVIKHNFRRYTKVIETSYSFLPKLEFKTALLIIYIWDLTLLFKVKKVQMPKGLYRIIQAITH